MALLREKNGVFLDVHYSISYKKGKEKVSSSRNCEEEHTPAGQVSREAGEKDYQSDKSHVRREKRLPVGQVSREAGKKAAGRTRLT